MDLVISTLIGNHMESPVSKSGAFRLVLPDLDTVASLKLITYKYTFSH